MNEPVIIDTTNNLYILNTSNGIYEEWTELFKEDIGKLVDDNSSSHYFIVVINWKKLKSGNYKIECVLDGTLDYRCNKCVLLLNSKGEILKNGKV
jgi:hypothetical protein